DRRERDPELAEAQLLRVARLEAGDEHRARVELARDAHIGVGAPGRRRAREEEVRVVVHEGGELRVRAPRLVVVTEPRLVDDAVFGIDVASLPRRYRREPTMHPAEDGELVEDGVA